MRPRAIGPCHFFAVLFFGLVAIPIGITAQAPVKGPVPVRFTATTENVSGAGESIKINLSSWSTDTERDQLLAAWTLSAATVPDGRGGRGGRGGGGARGGGARGARGGRGAAAAPATTDDPDAVDADNPAFRFGRGGARGRGDTDTPPETPQASLASALKKVSTVGILWTSETVGYSIKYAYRVPQPDGGERIILATDRRVGAWSNLWKPAGSANVTDYEFSLIELRVNSKGEGEGKGAVVGKVGVDTAAKSVVLDGYGTLPVVFKGVKRL